MRCDHCATEIPEPSRFCTKCGKALTSSMGIRTAIKRFLSALSTSKTSVPTEAPGSQGEERQILAEVNRRKERARQSGVIVSAFTLYERDLPYYDAWAKNCPELVHPAIKVTNKTEEGIGNESTKRIEALIRGNSYVFTFRETTTFMPDGEEFTQGYLDVDFQGQRVMTIDCSCRDDRYAGRIWSTEDVSGFIEGPWIAELNTVFAEVSHLEEARNKLAQERSKKAELEKLKRNFGL